MLRYVCVNQVFQPEDFFFFFGDNFSGSFLKLSVALSFEKKNKNANTVMKNATAHEIFTWWGIQMTKIHGGSWFFFSFQGGLSYLVYAGLQKKLCLKS